MPKLEYRGLCSTCKEASTCTYRRDPWQPIWQCEEFEGETSAVNTSPPTYRRVKFAAEDKSPGKYRGLCVNCENRETCTYPKAKGGVWHCDEYE